MAQITLNSTGVASSSALVLQSNGTTTAVTVSTAQIATFANDAVVNGLTVGRGLAAVATNTAVGASALSANQAGGTQNQAFGYRSLYSNISGSNNTAVGYQAGYSLTTPSANTFIGAGPNGGSGELITTGGKNSIFGAYNGNQGGLDIRTSSGYVVLSDGDGNPLVMVQNNASLALQGAGVVSGAGISFPATQSASTDANTLDDYEEGTFTPSCVCTGQTITLGTAVGTYTKIGNVVRAQIAIIVSTVSGAAGGNTTISGFPFSLGDTTYTGQGAIGYNDGFANTIGGTLMSSTNMLFRSGTRSSGNDGGGFTAGGYISITVVYRV